MDVSSHYSSAEIRRCSFLYCFLEIPDGQNCDATIAPSCSCWFICPPIIFSLVNTIETMVFGKHKILLLICKITNTLQKHKVVFLPTALNVTTDRNVYGQSQISKLFDLPKVYRNSFGHHAINMLWGLC